VYRQRLANTRAMIARLTNYSKKHRLDGSGRYVIQKQQPLTVFAPNNAQNKGKVQDSTPMTIIRLMWNHSENCQNDGAVNGLQLSEYIIAPCNAKGQYASCRHAGMKCAPRHGKSIAIAQRQSTALGRRLFKKCCVQNMQAWAAVRVKATFPSPGVVS
jgi:hypothetical protein